MKFDPHRFGLRLREIRGGWTQRELEKRTGISNAYLSQLENGQIDSPGIEVIAQLATALGMSVDDLLEGAIDVQSDIRAEACPFCGSPNVDVTEFGDIDGNACQIECRRCKAHGPIIRGPVAGNCTEGQRARATAKWNRRTNG